MPGEEVVASTRAYLRPLLLGTMGAALLGFAFAVLTVRGHPQSGDVLDLPIRQRGIGLAPAQEKPPEFKQSIRRASLKHFAPVKINKPNRPFQRRVTVGPACG